MAPTRPDPARRTPDKPAYIMAGRGDIVTYRELDAATNRGAQLFRSLGLKTGDGIAIFMENNRHFLEVCWAARRAGLYYTAISSYLTAPEVAYIVNDCGAKALITSAARAEAASGLMTEEMLACEHRLMVDGEVAGFRAYEAAIAEHPPTPIADEVQGTDMLYSSGTTGRPKGIKRPMIGETLGTREPIFQVAKTLYRINEGSVYLSPAPLYHAAPMRFNMTIIDIGATSVIMERFDAEEALRLIGTYKATHSQWVPTMFVRMLKLPEETRQRYDISSMRIAIHAAAPCPLPVKEQMIDWWGPIVYEYYGGTEGNGFCAISCSDWLAHKGSVGTALVGKLRIVDDDGNRLPAGQEGIIYFADGPPYEYHEDLEKTARARNDKGWTTLGDVGYVDDVGFLYLTDRKAHMIITGGVNIYPQEIENLLVTHPAVLDVAVIGMPDDEMGEAVKAVVQPTDMAAAGSDLADELIAFCREHLSKIKLPRSVDFQADLPRHVTGKLYKRLLKDRYWGKTDSCIV
jgi:long-chain acyl-CoA synthetase